MWHITSSLALGLVSLLASACGPSEPSGLERFDATLPSSAWAEAPGGRCPALTVTVTGSGEATPGGPFTMGASHCLDLASGDYPTITDGQFAFTFESGATLTGTHEGNLIPTETGLYGVEVGFLFTAGTGEFADPSGDASFSTPADSTSGRLDRQTGQATKLWLSGLFIR